MKRVTTKVKIYGFVNCRILCGSRSKYTMMSCECRAKQQMCRRWLCTIKFLSLTKIELDNAKRALRCTLIRWASEEEGLTDQKKIYELVALEWSNIIQKAISMDSYLTGMLKIICV